MKLFYKDYNNPSFELDDTGYLLPSVADKDKEYPYYSNEISKFIIKPEDNGCYFAEDDILAKINANEDNYFDFNKAIIDIGAHVGYYSFGSLFKKGYAFEPNKFICAFTQMNLIMHNKFDNFKIYDVLLSDDKTPVKYDGFNNEYTFTESLESVDQKLTELFGDNKDIQLVIPHILDEYDCKDVGLIKIDTEGMEEKILRGGIGTIIRNNYPPILFELWGFNMTVNVGETYIAKYNMDENRCYSLENLLYSLGYEIIWQWGDYETHLAINKKHYDKYVIS